jgi:hypothetical protein
VAEAARHRRLLAIAALTVAPSLLTGCGGAPSRDDFVAKTKDSIGADLAAGLEAQGVDEETGDRLITDFVECQYDAIKDDADLLQKAYDDPSDADISVRLDTAASTCVTELSTAMADAISAAGGSITTTTLPTDTLPEDTLPADTLPAAEPTTTIP